MNKLRNCSRLAGLILLGFSAAAPAADWPQWLGPARDGVWQETGLLEKLPATLTPRWRAEVALGYSGPAVAGGRVFVTDYLRTEGDVTPNAAKKNELLGAERVLAFDVRTGRRLWAVEHQTAYKLSYPNGPRATPTVDGDRVFTLGAMGRLLALDTATGRELWARDFIRDYRAETPMWGYSSHPLVVGDVLITTIGLKDGAVIAFDKATGQERWRSVPAPEPGYAPPVLLDNHGQRQVVQFTPEGLHGLDPATGALQWSASVKPLYGMAIMAPQVSGDRVFAGGIVGVSALYRLGSDARSATLVWKGGASDAVGPKNGMPFIVGEHLYGFDRDGDLRCVELGTGRRVWSSLAAVGGRSANSATAFLVRNGDRWVILNEQGELIFARLSPAGYEEISRARLIEPTTPHGDRLVLWMHPAFAHQGVFARNDRELICVSLAGN